MLFSEEFIFNTLKIPPVMPSRSVIVAETKMDDVLATLNGVTVSMDNNMIAVVDKEHTQYGGGR